MRMLITPFYFDCCHRREAHHLFGPTTLLEVIELELSAIEYVKDFPRCRRVGNVFENHEN